jgi:superfamily II DNA helicase RecQ
MVEENLRGIFGLDGFRPLQREAIDAVLRVRER